MIRSFFVQILLDSAERWDPRARFPTLLVATLLLACNGASRGETPVSIAQNRSRPSSLQQAETQKETKKPADGRALRLEPSLEARLRQRTTLLWSEVPRGEALTRLRTVVGLPLFIDRRVDTEPRMQLRAQNEPVYRLLDRLAESEGLGLLPVGSSLWVLPEQEAAAWQAELSEGNAAQRKTSRRVRRQLSKQAPFAWKRLAEPRRLVESLAEEGGFQINHADRIPHDLWPAVELPQLSLADRMTLVLGSFDLTWQLNSKGKQLAVESLDSQRKHDVASVLSLEQRLSAKQPVSNNQSPAPAAADALRFTLRVEAEPLRRVLQQVARAAGKELAIDASAESLADARISLSVKEATLEELIQQAAAEAGLAASLQADTIRLTAAP